MKCSFRLYFVRNKEINDRFFPRNFPRTINKIVCHCYSFGAKSAQIFNNFFEVLSKCVLMRLYSPLWIVKMIRIVSTRAKNDRAPIAMSCLNVLNVTSMATKRWTPNCAATAVFRCTLFFFAFWWKFIFARRRRCVRRCWLCFPFCLTARGFSSLSHAACVTRRGGRSTSRV